MKEKQPNVRINEAAHLFMDKIEGVSVEEPPPDVIICTLPTEIEYYCGFSEETRGAKTPRPTRLELEIAELEEKGQTFLNDWAIEIESEPEPGKSYDFRNALKGLVMQHDIPIQILLQSTAEGILDYTPSSGLQHPSTFAWNLSTGLYYKARGRPWRLAKLAEGSCYIGVAFYVNKLNVRRNVETSMAQVFTHTGEGFVLRGSDVTVDEFTREPHLTESQANDLLEDALNLYTKKTGTNPNRVVIHKTSKFTGEEKSGFEEVITETPRDFVAIAKEHEIKFLRTGRYPILRGTIIQISRNQYLLYTVGYIPRLRTYPGHRIPIPLLITHKGDSEISRICSEILGLTKLNWNTTQFSTQLPITLEFARRVGKVLSELPKDSKMKNHFRFYM